MLLSLGFLHCCIRGERCYFLHVGYLLKGKDISKSYYRGQKYLSDRFCTSSLTSCLQSFLTISASSGRSSLGWRSSLGLCWCQHRVCLELCPESICLEAVLEILISSIFYNKVIKMMMNFDSKVLRNPFKKTAHSRNCHGEGKCCTKRAGLGPWQQAVPRRMYRPGACVGKRENPSCMSQRFVPGLSHWEGYMQHKCKNISSCIWVEGPGRKPVATTDFYTTSCSMYFSSYLLCKGIIHLLPNKATNFSSDFCHEQK